MIKAVVFDMDGVLFDTERISREAWFYTARQMGIEAQFEPVFLRAIGMNRSDTREMFLSIYGNDFSYETFQTTSSQKFHELIEQELPMKPGVHEILSWLRAHKVPTALASSTSKKSVLSHLSRPNLTDFFDDVITGDMVVHSKPHPEIYEMACRAIHTAPVDCIAVEDSKNGIRSAFAAGMKPIMIPDQVQPDDETAALLFKKYDSLLCLLDDLPALIDC